MKKILIGLGLAASGTALASSPGCDSANVWTGDADYFPPKLSAAEYAAKYNITEAANGTTTIPAEAANGTTAAAPPPAEDDIATRTMADATACVSGLLGVDGFESDVATAVLGLTNPESSSSKCTQSLLNEVPASVDFACIGFLTKMAANAQDSSVSLGEYPGVGPSGGQSVNALALNAELAKGIEPFSSFEGSQESDFCEAMSNDVLMTRCFGQVDFLYLFSQMAAETAPIACADFSNDFAEIMGMIGSGIGGQLETEMKYGKDALVINDDTWRALKAVGMKDPADAPSSFDANVNALLTAASMAASDEGKANLGKMFVGRALQDPEASAVAAVLSDNTTAQYYVIGAALAQQFNPFGNETTDTPGTDLVIAALEAAGLQYKSGLPIPDFPRTGSGTMQAMATQIFKGQCLATVWSDFVQEHGAGTTWEGEVPEGTLALGLGMSLGWSTGSFGSDTDAAMADLGADVVILLAAISNPSAAAEAVVMNLLSDKPGIGEIMGAQGKGALLLSNVVAQKVNPASNVTLDATLYAAFTDAGLDLATYGNSGMGAMTAMFADLHADSCAATEFDAWFDGLDKGAADLAVKALNLTLDTASDLQKLKAAGADPNVVVKNLLSDKPGIGEIMNAQGKGALLLSNVIAQKVNPASNVTLDATLSAAFTDAGLDLATYGDDGMGAMMAMFADLHADSCAATEFDAWFDGLNKLDADQAVKALNLTLDTASNLQKLKAAGADPSVVLMNLLSDSITYSILAPRFYSEKQTQDIPILSLALGGLIDMTDTVTLAKDVLVSVSPMLSLADLVGVPIGSAKRSMMTQSSVFFEFELLYLGACLTYQDFSGILCAAAMFGAFDFTDPSTDPATLMVDLSAYGGTTFAELYKGSGSCETTVLGFFNERILESSNSALDPKTVLDDLVFLYEMSMLAVEGAAAKQLLTAASGTITDGAAACVASKAAPVVAELMTFAVEGAAANQLLTAANGIITDGAEACVASKAAPVVVELMTFAGQGTFVSYIMATLAAEMPAALKGCLATTSKPLVDALAYVGAKAAGDGAQLSNFLMGAFQENLVPGLSALGAPDDEAALAAGLTVALGLAGPSSLLTGLQILQRGLSSGGGLVGFMNDGFTTSEALQMGGSANVIQDACSINASYMPAVNSLTTCANASSVGCPVDVTIDFTRTGAPTLPPSTGAPVTAAPTAGDNPCIDYVAPSDDTPVCHIVDPGAMGGVEIIANERDCAYFRSFIIWFVARSDSLPLPWAGLAGMVNIDKCDVNSSLVGGPNGTLCSSDPKEVHSASDELFTCGLVPYLVSHQCAWNYAVKNMKSSSTAGAIGAAYAHDDAGGCDVPGSRASPVDDKGVAKNQSNSIREWEYWVATAVAGGWTGNETCADSYGTYGANQDGSPFDMQAVLEAAQFKGCGNEIDETISAPVAAPVAAAPIGPIEPVETTTQTVAIVLPSDTSSSELVAAASASAAAFDGMGAITATVVLQSTQEVSIPDDATEAQKSGLLEVLTTTSCGTFLPSECGAAWVVRRRRGRALAAASFTVTFTLDPEVTDFAVPEVIITMESLNAALVDAGVDVVIASVSVAVTVVSIEVTVETVGEIGADVAVIDAALVLAAVADNVEGVGVDDLDAVISEIISVVTTGAPVTAAPSTAPSDAPVVPPAAAPTAVAPTASTDVIAGASQSLPSMAAAVFGTASLALALAR